MRAVGRATLVGVVSIRPRPAGRGKLERRPRRARQRLRFQSAPGPQAGGNSRIRAAGLFGLNVSIRPRPAGRGKQPRPRPSSHRQRFNPPPARRPGETRRGRRSRRRQAAVSIRPRPAGQGKRSDRAGDRRRPEVSIRPRPAGQGKPDARRSQWPGADGFNPPPARRPGETVRCIGASSADSTRFNPPPARRPGETRAARRDGSRYERFQSAPGPQARGNSARSVSGAVVARTVSIRPRPAGQGKRTWRVTLDAIRAFQSAPGPQARGNGMTQRHASRAMHVSIRPRPAGQGKRDACVAPRHASRQVSIRPRPAGQGKPVSSGGHATFQSAPGPGRGNSARAHAAEVSIRPRPAGQGKRRSAASSAVMRACFNPPPARRPGETAVSISGTRTGTCEGHSANPVARDPADSYSTRHACAPPFFATPYDDRGRPRARPVAPGPRWTSIRPPAARPGPSAR